MHNKFFLKIFEIRRTLSQFYKFEKLIWKAKIFTISFRCHFRTTVTSSLADFQKKKKIYIYRVWPTSAQTSQKNKLKSD